MGRVRKLPDTKAEFVHVFIRLGAFIPFCEYPQMTRIVNLQQVEK